MRDIICIGASAGGVEALTQLVKGFAPDLAASVFVVLHVSADQPSRLAEILDRMSPLRVAVASDGEEFTQGRIYVAPPDHHLLIEAGHIVIIKGPKENRCRPAIDPLFRSAAQHYGHRAIGVLLSGMLDDGTAGLWALKRSGGLAIVQDPADSIFPAMAVNALQHVQADYSVPAAELGPLLSKLARHPSAEIQYDAGISELTEVENEYAKLNEVPRNRLDAIGRPSSLMCPLCSSLLWQLKEGPRRFRCHSGHAFAPGALMVEHRELTEQTLAVLMILIDDEVTLSRQVLETSTDPEQRRVIAQDLRSSEMRATALRELLPGGVRSPKKVRPSVS